MPPIACVCAFVETTTDVYKPRDSESMYLKYFRHDQRPTVSLCSVETRIDARATRHRELDTS